MKSNILVVDDEVVARQSLTDILKLEGYNAIAVPNGQAAIEHVRTHPIDLMIVDLRLRIHDYLTKPASPAQVIASVKKGLARRNSKLQAKSGLADSVEVDESIK